MSNTGIAQLTEDNLIKFILAQPDEKAVNMKQSFCDFPERDEKDPSFVGCILVQFGISVGLKHFSCGMSRIYFTETENVDLGRLTEHIVRASMFYKTFKEVKELIPKCRRSTNISS